MQRILLADDDLEVRLGVADLLGSLGLEVLQAESGLQALEVAGRIRIHAALLDWNMPGCSGLEAMPLIKHGRDGLPCIVYSGNLTEDMERMALHAGAWAVLHKPVRPELLRREVLRALEGAPTLGWGPGELN